LLQIIGIGIFVILVAIVGERSIVLSVAQTTNFFYNNSSVSVGLGVRRHYLKITMDSWLFVGFQ